MKLYNDYLKISYQACRVISMVMMVLDSGRGWQTHCQLADEKMHMQGMWSFWNPISSCNKDIVVFEGKYFEGDALVV